ncbi:MAG TPA: DUF2950 family protein [Phycisphaerales bacterium]|nr:DUF2950 family protein [Phycisphaerales bacterium]HMP36358.1 DUF2950 family protein [Phycisphaerales bacterium]
MVSINTQRQLERATRRRCIGGRVRPGVLVAILLVAGAGLSGCQTAPASPDAELRAALAERRPAADQSVFASPEEAVQALGSAAARLDRPAIARILGPAASELLSGAGEVDDEELARFAASIRERFELVDIAALDPALVSGRTILAIRHGSAARVFPIPLDSFDGAWFFDTPVGVAELKLRRIGANELRTIAALRALVAAQEEYALVDHDGDGVLAYAVRIESTPGRRDGLFWQVDWQVDLEELIELPPVGPLVAAASLDQRGKGAVAYHGYLYRMLVPPAIAEPFLFVAVPAAYRVSGVMTFAVGPDGQVRERDLGPAGTDRIIAGGHPIDPSGWPVAEP